MSPEDKVKNAAEHAVGKAKEKIGEVTHNDSLANEGRGDQVKADAKSAAEKVKDAFGKLKE